MQADHTLIKLHQLLTNIISILKQEKENIWVNTFEKMSIEIDMALQSSISKEESLKYLRDTYISIYQGNGSFSDFSIWRDSPKERIEANENFKKLTSKLQNLMEINR